MKLEKGKMEQKEEMVTTIIPFFNQRKKKRTDKITTNSNSNTLDQIKIQSATKFRFFFYSIKKNKKI